MLRPHTSGVERAERGRCQGGSFEHHRDANSPQLEVLPLYASLPPTAQVKIFSDKPKNTRRVIVATNIAETSITIPGVAYVVDTGYKKEKEYIFRTSGGASTASGPVNNVLILAIEHLAKKSVSQAAAWQRTGRAGREVGLPRQ